MTVALLQSSPHQALSFESLWREAESLGPVEVSWQAFRDEVRIRIKALSGGGAIVWPAASDADVFIALSRALERAKKLLVALA